MHILTTINLFLWGGPLLILLLGTHLYLTAVFRFPQRQLLIGLKYAFQSSGIKTLSTTLAATLGTGNIIGVGTAVFFGGPGAVFWCWITGILGMATTYAESFYSLKFQKSGHGGTMYILKQIGQKKLACFYAALICLSSFLVGCTTQTNAIVVVCQSFLQVPAVIIGLVVATLTGLVILKGKNGVEKFCSTLVPAMSLLFIGSCLYLIVLNINILPRALACIIKSAFSSQAVSGGILGFSVIKAMRFGIARGLFTNEAGLGTAGIISAESPRQNLNGQSALSMCATFFDTVIMCGITGIVVVIYLLTNPGFLISGDAATLSTNAFSIIPHIGNELLAIEIFCFALATLIGWSYIGLQGAEFLKKQRDAATPVSSKANSHLYQWIYLIMIVAGALFPLEFIWEITDFINALLVLPCVGSLWYLTLWRKR